MNDTKFKLKINPQTKIKNEANSTAIIKTN